MGKFCVYHMCIVTYPEFRARCLVGHQMACDQAAVNCRSAVVLIPQSLHVQHNAGASVTKSFSEQVGHCCCSCLSGLRSDCLRWYRQATTLAADEEQLDYHGKARDCMICEFWHGLLACCAVLCTPNRSVGLSRSSAQCEYGSRGRGRYTAER